jgi:hypothetical protein
VKIDRDDVDAQEFLAELLRLEAARGGGATVGARGGDGARGRAAPAPRATRP